jgi:nucleotide-binding universal stress UspA family protein
MGDRIVVGTDGSESAGKAVAEALRIARGLDGEVHVVSAYRPIRIDGASVPGEFAGMITSRNHVDSVLADATARARVAEVTCTAHAVEGDPTSALLKVVDAVDATMLVVGNRGLNGVKRFLLGSVPSKIVHDAPCTTLIVHTT